MEEDSLAPLDTLNDILEVARGVVEDYGPGPGRIERMAFWILENLNGFWSAQTLVRQMVSNDPQPEPTLMGPGRKMTSNEARQFAAALLHAADEAEK